MNLEKHISDLLYNHDCVIVPEFGAFLTHRNTAILKDNSIYPPSKTMGFNASLQKSDGLLIQTFAQRNNLSFEEAKREIENQISLWRNHLDKNHSLLLEYLGSFTKNDSGTLEFIPINKNYLLDAFGLESVRAKYIMQTVPEMESSNGVWWKVASIVPLLVGGYLYFGKPQPVTDFVNEQWSGFVAPLIHQHSPVIKTASPANTIKVINETAAEATAKAVAEAANHDYLVIAGSFRLKTEAESMEANLKEKGFTKALFTEKRGNYFYVAFDAFSTKEEALAYRKSIGESFPEAWVLSLNEN